MRAPRPEDCLQGGGEMGALMRAFDWSRTPVGPVEQWPQSLRTAVSMMLETRFGMYIAWGRDFTQFYNDGYRPILGSTKHPAIGKSTRETFAEIWPIIGPMFDGVMEGEAVRRDDGMLPLDRHGFAEECYFIFSYSPIRDETGGVGGVLVTVTETTAGVLGQRRLATLRDLAASAAASKDVEAAWRQSFEILAQNRSDLPFAMLYALDGDAARLVGASGAERGSAAAPQVIEPGGADPWGLAAAIAAPAPTVLRDVRDRVGTLSGGPWPEAPHTAVVLPIQRPGGERPYGVLIAGTSPRLVLDADYDEFLSMAAGHVGTAIANASAYEEERRRAEALAELDRAKTTFFSNVSHEFRTPLTLMLGPLQELADEQPAALQGRLDTVHRNAQRLLKLVNSLLDFARIEAGRMQAAFVPTDVAQLTADLASSFRSAIERAGLTLVVDCPPLPAPVHVDRDMWEKIVLNLVSNAFKFTFEGEIRVQTAWTGSTARLIVRDTGTGIAPDQLPRIFDRFHRVPGARSRTHEGTGIGLALVQELVRQHGGTITVESEPGRGSTFTVEIPAGHQHLPADRIGRPSTLTPTTIGAAPFVEEATRWLPEIDDSLAGQAAPTTSAGSIVVADDNADMREYLRRILSRHWRVTTVADGREALAVARQTRPDLVLTDVMMPGLDGFELLRELRAHRDTREARVVMLSARAGEDARIEGLQAGADDYLVKPFSARELVARVEAQLLRGRIRTVEDAHRRRLAEVFSQAPLGIAILQGPEHVFELANAAYRELLAGRDVVGMPIREALPELAGQGIFELLDEVYRTGRPWVGRSHRVQLERGQPRRLDECFFDFVYQPLVAEHGDVDGIIVVAYEVTELVRARRDAEVASRAKDEFLALLGHELRNPLSPIVTALELMHLRGSDVHERERAVIDRQVKHLTALVDDLLDISRITRGKVELRQTRLAVADVVSRAIEMASPLLESRRHTLLVDVDPSLHVDGDPTRLAQVVSNLLTNAGKYTDPGGRIVVTGRAEEGWLVLSVRDNGIGIAPELLPRVYDMFVQGAQPIDRGSGGLGLGLAIVQSLVKLHGGTVAAESAGRGAGSTFTIRLPVAAGTIAAAPAEAPPPQAVAGAARRVLVVDDNHDAAELLADALHDEGHTVCVAFDGPSALSLAADFQPEVALVDIGLPVMDGYELASRLRELLGGAVRLVAISGYGQPQDRDHALSAGFERLLVKPVDVGLIHAVLDEATD